MKPKITVLYHFYYPDDVVSARHFQDLCEDLAAMGWDVEVWPSNRSCRGAGAQYASHQEFRNVHIHRVWRPAWRQSSAFGRVANSLWMISAWCLRWIFSPGSRSQIVLIGTDPVLGLLAGIGIRAVDSKVKIVHWCFDLYPEAAVADGKLKEKSPLNLFLSWLMGQAYQACRGIVDLGSCMRAKLNRYASPAARATLTPWAFYEPKQIQTKNSEEYRSLFGDASLGLLYSGNFGLAHSATLIGELAKQLASEKIRVSFSVRGHGEKSLRQQSVQNGWPISFSDFASEERLNIRLEAADVHLISLKENWTGTVVPSKFFGAIAAGRPVIFEGSEESAVARWIREYRLGWVLTPRTLTQVADDLRSLALKPEKLKELQTHCLEIYHQFFSRRIIMREWDSFLRQLL